MQIDKLKNISIPRPRRLTLLLSRLIVVTLSFCLIAYISYDTFMDIPFLENHDYMTFQFWVCVAFLVDFFVELACSEDRSSYLRSRWFFFLISIPYLNIVNLTGLHLSAEAAFFVRFVPLVRGGYALAMVVGYISSNRAVSMLWQYISIVVVLVYLLALIFYYEEHGINPHVKDFWDALYFSCLYVTTVGCTYGAMTPVGKVVSIILPTAGMLMLPMFTVYITAQIRHMDQKRKARLAARAELMQKAVESPQKAEQ